MSVSQIKVMMRFSETFYAIGALCGLALTVFGLYDVYGFASDLIAGKTTTADPAYAPEVLERAKDASRYGVLTAAWLRDLFFGVVAFIACGWAWRRSRQLGREQ